MVDVPMSGRVKDLITAPYGWCAWDFDVGPCWCSTISPDSKPQFAVANKPSDDSMVDRSLVRLGQAGFIRCYGTYKADRL